MLAKRTHAPQLAMLLEIGVAEMQPVDTPVGLADSRIFYRATCWSGFLDTLGMNLHRGVVDVRGIRRSTCDRFGNVNTFRRKTRRERGWRTTAPGVTTWRRWLSVWW